MYRFSRVLIALITLISATALAPHIASSPGAPFRQWFVADAAGVQEDVSIRDFEFVPDTIIVSTGTTVQWTNSGSFNHTVTNTDPSMLFDSGPIAPGGHFDRLFATPGIYNYQCMIHPSMIGKVIVASEVSHAYLPLIVR